MPLYEYVCTKCEHEFEQLVNTGEEAECPHCSAKDVERQLSVPGIPKTQSLPVSCNPSLPPCGPGCCRLP